MLQGKTCLGIHVSGRHACARRQVPGTCTEANAVCMVTQCQCSLCCFVLQVLPLFSNFCARYTGCQPMLDAVVSNYQYWKSKAPPKPNKE